MNVNSNTKIKKIYCRMSFQHLIEWKKQIKMTALISEIELNI